MSEDIPGYRAVHWEPLDILSAESLSRMSGNIQAIHDYTPRARWNGGTNHHDQNIKIMSGRKAIAKGKAETTTPVKFNGFFSPNCQPNITLGINAAKQQNLYCTFSGAAGAGLTPNSDGFIIHLQAAKEDGEKKKIAYNVWVHWIAMGY